MRHFTRVSQGTTCAGIGRVLLLATTLACTAAFYGCNTADDNNSSAGTSSVHAALSEPDVRVSVDADGTASFEGAPVSGDVGAPGLPVEVIRLLVDPNADLSKVTARLEGAREQDISGTFNVKPIPLSATDEGPIVPANKRIVDGKDMDTYELNEFYPQSNVARIAVGRLHQYQIVTVTISRLRYNPVTGALKQLVGGQLVLDVPRADGATAISLASNTRHEAQVVDLVQNASEALPAYRGNQSKSGSGVASASSALVEGGAYLIVTSDSIAANSAAVLGHFADEKARTGQSVKMVTGTQFLSRDARHRTWVCANSSCVGWGGGTGDAAANALRSWLQQNYQTANIDYAMLIGDPRMASGDVPMKLCDGAGSDYYYAELSGSWSLCSQNPPDYANSGIDGYAELAVGRIPYYGVPADLADILRKSIEYENSTNTVWRQQALLAMKPLSECVQSYELGEEIRTDALIPSDMGAHRIYDEEYLVEPSTTPCTSDTVTQGWLADTPGLVVWQTHGWSSGAVDVMDTSKVGALNDSRPAIVYQGSCSNAYPFDENNLAYSLLRNGAIGTVAGTDLTGYGVGSKNYTSLGSTDGELAYRFAMATVTSKASIADALNTARQRGNSVDQNWLRFAVYGDPSLGLYSSGRARAKNLALGKTATQSSTYAIAVANLAVDGVTDGFFNNGSVTHTDGAAPGWWQVDLGQIEPIGNVTLWNRTDCCGRRIEGADVIISDVPLPNAMLSDPLPAGMVRIHVPQFWTASTDVPVHASGRYVRIEQPNSYPLSLAEVEVWQEPNIAYGKATQQSSTLSDGISDVAVDGNTDGNWYSGSVTHTDGESHAWWQVDLGASEPLGRMVIWNRSDCCGDRLSNFDVLVSDSPFPSGVVSEPFAAYIWRRHIDSVPGQSITLPMEADGRYVRIQLAGTNSLSLAEVQLWRRQNIALNKAASQSSTATVPNTSDVAAAARAVDGNAERRDYTSSQTSSETKAWWQVDLGQVEPIGRVNAVPPKGKNGWSGDITLMVASTPFPSGAQTTPCPSGMWCSTQNTLDWNKLPVNYRGRYVRIQRTGAGSLGLTEVEIYRQPNLALGAAVSQSSLAEGGVPTRAVDGISNGAWGNGSVTHTLLESQAWWQVDLGSTPIVSHVRVHNRTDDCCSYRLSNFDVLVSSNLFPAGPLAAPYPAGVWSSHVDTMSSSSLLLALPNATAGRYVRVQLAGTNPLSLAEVEVNTKLQQ